MFLQSQEYFKSILRTFNFHEFMNIDQIATIKVTRISKSRYSNIQYILYYNSLVIFNLIINLFNSHLDLFYRLNLPLGFNLFSWSFRLNDNVLAPMSLS